MRVLFLCTANSCRSILAEAAFNHLAADGQQAGSAGSHPSGQVQPRALALLEQEGIDTAGLHSKSWDEIEFTPDIIITVCDNAAGEACPLFLGKAVRAHWGVADPVRATGSEAEIQAAYESAYRTLRHRIETFLALPLDRLSPETLKDELDRIGHLTP